MATLRHLAAALLLLCSLYSTSADNNTQEVQRELETEEIEENFIIEDEFDNLFPGVLVQAKFEDVKTCWLETEFKEPCKSKKNDGNVGMTNITECVLEHECCYYRHPNRPEEPTCYQSRKVLGRMKNNQFGVYALDASVLIGDVTGYPSGVRPGPVITTTSNTYYYGTQRPTISIIKPKVQNYRFSYNSYIFTFHKVRRTYARARAECDSHATSTYGSMLLEITSEQTQKFINEKLKDWMSEYPTGGWDDDVFSVGYWIGGSDRDTEGSWKWDSGIEIPMTSSGSKYENWYKNKYYREPNNASPEDDCISMAATNRVGTNQNTLGKWFDANCASKRYYICMSGSKVRQAGGVYSISRSSCAPNTCANGGRCYSTSSGSGFSCVCTSGYSGPRCRIPPPTRSTTLPPPLPTLTTCCSVPTYNRRPCGGYTGSRAPRSYCKQVLQCCYNDLTGACYEPRPGCRVLPPTARPTTTPVTQAPTTRPPSGGFWLKWSGWSVCSRSCGEGRWTRIRGCMNGEPGKGGCIGQAVDTSNCNERQCDRGTWGVWGEWSGCSADCGVGISFRLRTCVTNSDTDLPCVGDSREQRQCETGRPCVASWASWGSWGSCSVTCGSGSFRRSRKCIGGNAGEGGCVGSGIDVIPCESIPPCPVTTWGAWTEYSQCDVTCGKGSYRRTRICSNGNIGDQGCTPAVDAEEVAECFASIPTCSFWAQWTDYGVCSADCGGGIQTRTRECIGGSGCIGDSQEFRTCNNQACASWESWSSWSSCNQDCGTGITKRTRKCIGGEAGGPGCEGSDLEETTCNTQDCAAWSEWSDYSQCSSDCGGGRSVRTRECLGGEVGDVGCLGPAIDERDCNTRECESWTEWGSWSDCSADCDGGITTRTRTCKNGFAGLGNCQGNSEDVETCNTQTCSEWGSWSDGECSVTCGDGILIRVRECIGGIAGISDGCLGDSRVEMECNEGACATRREFGPWQAWDECSSTCGGGETYRRRICAEGPNKCEGVAMEKKKCATEECPDWSEWSDWSQCSVTCGEGQQSRDRTCTNGVIDRDCVGAPKEIRNCVEKECQKFWAEWGSWSDCSVSCGGGITIRSRVCGEKGDNDDNCVGEATETLPCSSEECPKWSNWSQWSDCDVTCGTGNRARQRNCENGGTVGVDCIGSAIDAEECIGQCSISWNEWGGWSVCDVSCGGGEMLRFRTCNGGIAGVDCGGDPVESQICNLQNCPTWSEYGDWSECSASCGVGERIRVRACDGGIAGVDCEGEALDGKDCKIKSCPSWSEYGEWSQCSSSCGEGEQIRIRLCNGGEAGVDCPGEDMETQICNIRECVTWTQWGAWSDCSVTCGNGETVRARTCTDGIAGVDCPGNAVETRACNKEDCVVVVITWANWMQWSQCDATCGFAERVRLRVCDGGEGGVDCPGGEVQAEQCALMLCPFWDDWSSWSACSTTCGDGNRSRDRECFNGVVGVDCMGFDFEAEACSNGDCPRWGEYTPWSECSVSCGQGIATRTKLCIVGSAGGNCIGEADETRPCQIEACVSGEWGPWQQWSVCSATCGGGERNRLRVCIGGEAGFGGCPGPDSEIGICGGSDSDGCPKWSSWSTWSECSATCAGGKKRHTRICINEDVGEGCGDGPTSAEMDCNTQLCPFWGVWTSWSGCSKSCDGGLRERSRECTNGFPGDIGCDEFDGVGEIVQGICNPQVCPRFGPWSDWSACNGTCGGAGIRTHTRQCIGGEVGQLGCEGPVSEDQDCDGSPCAFWSPWDGWGSCTKPCGGGVRSRGRLCVHGDPGESGCEGPDSQTEVCNQETCSYWSEWGEWGACSRSCGEAERFRIRLCINGEIGETGCDIGSSTEVADCPVLDCSACSPNFEFQGLNNGFVACTLSTSIGSICTFSCEDNYQLVGIDSSTCKETSSGVFEWSVAPPTCQERCSDETDIVFVIDSSSSIKEQNFKVIRSFIKQVVRRFRIGPDAALVGALRYNKEVSKLWNLNSYITLDQVLDAIENIPYDGSGTMTGQAIQYAHEHMFKAEAGRRPGVPKVVVVITDGVSFDDVNQPSELLKGQGALIVAVGIGNVNIGEINDIASDPDRNFATTVSDFDSLPKVVSTIADQVKLCQPIDIPLNCPPQALIDLVFIVDSSSSIGLQNFETIRKFIKDIIVEFNVGYDSAMFGLILFNRDVNEIFQLQDYDEKSEVLNAIDGMPYKGSGTRTGKALTYAAANSFLESAGGREKVPKVSIVITDGKSQDNVQNGANQLKQNSNVIAIGIEGAVKTELNQIASYSSNVFTTRFETLGDVMEQLKMAVCFASRAGTMVV